MATVCGCERRSGPEDRQPARGTRGVPKRQAAAELVQVHLGSKQLKAGFV